MVSDAAARDGAALVPASGFDLSDGEARTRLERLVDRDAGLGPFCGGDHDELHVARGVTHDEDPLHARLPEMVCLHGALAGELAAEIERKPALLRLAGRKEDGLAFF